MNKILLPFESTYKPSLPGRNGLGALPPVPTPTPENSSVYHYYSQRLQYRQNNIADVFVFVSTMCPDGYLIKFQ